MCYLHMGWPACLILHNLQQDKGPSKTTHDIKFIRTTANQNLMGGKMYTCIPRTTMRCCIGMPAASTPEQMKVVITKIYSETDMMIQRMNILTCPQLAVSAMISSFCSPSFGTRSGITVSCITILHSFRCSQVKFEHDVVTNSYCGKYYSI